MVTICFKVTEEEARLLRQRARGEKLSVSAYLRRQASAPPAAGVTPGLVRCPHTGAMVFEPLREQKPLTTEAVRELLSDFP